MAADAAIDLDDDFWDDLLVGIEERRVIPIIGPELLQYGAAESFGRQTALALAAKLKLPAAALPDGFGLDEVVACHLQNRGRREDLYARLKTVVRELALPPPQALQDLAAILDFELFVSLGFDAMLVEALDARRHGGQPRTQHLAFAPNKAQDLPAERQRGQAPVVYALLGKLSSMPEYAVSEEDKLEFLHALQADAQRPELLFDELQNNHLLLLGCAFPDWLARFFIRIAKSRPLSSQRAEVETIVERGIAGEQALTLFLERFSYGTRVKAVDPVAFVAELARRWQARRPAAQADAVAAAPAGPEADDGAVFLSYASEDLAAATALCQGLQRQGLDVWFDKGRLAAGDLYDQMIRRRIKACPIFLPLVSVNTDRRLEGYFRREWRLAEERVEGIAEHVPFILPVAIDDTPQASPLVPAAFSRAQWTRLPRGEPSDEFGARVVALVRAYRKRQVGLQ